MRYWGGKTPRVKSRDLAFDRRGALAAELTNATPQSGDVVLKPFIDDRTGGQRFRIETWATHARLDGPFEQLRAAMDAAFELGLAARLSVWLDYSTHPDVHELDSIPLYCAATINDSESVA